MINITNRSVFVVTPKSEAIAWAKVTPEDDPFEMPEEAIIKCLTMAFAIDNNEDIPEIDQLNVALQENHDEIFSHILNGWCVDESTWPKINLKTFHEWFDVSFHEMLFDLGEIPFESELDPIWDDDEDFE